MKGGPRSQYYGVNRRPAVQSVNGGFTILELIIVMVVTMALLGSVLILVNGRQRQTSFNQSIRNIQTELRTTMGEVGSGYYQNSGSVVCNEVGGAVTLTGGGTNSEGTNKPCLFMGKVIQFAVGSATSPTYNIYTVAGLNKDPLTLLTSKARAVARGGSETTVPDDQFVTKTLQYGLTVREMTFDSGNDIGAFAFIYNMSQANVDDGSQSVNIVPIDGTNLGDTKLQGVEDINNKLPVSDSLINRPSGVKICFESGGTKQSGLITIGGYGRQADVKLDIFNTVDCT